MTEHPAIHAAIAACMLDIGGVAKQRRNQQQGYNFRGIADVYLACQPVMANHGLHILPYRVISEESTEGQTKSGGVMYRRCQRIEFRLYAQDGSFVQLETTGEAMDTGDKAANKCMSAAMKYALIQVFAIPEEDPTVDTENESLEMIAPPSTKPRVTIDTSAIDATPSAPAPAPKEDEKIKAAKVRTLVIAIKDAGISEPNRKPWMSDQLGRPVDSSKDLTVEEIDMLITRANVAKGGGAA